MLVVCAFADHCVPSVLELGRFSCGGRVNAFPPLGSATALHCFCRAVGCFGSWDTYLAAVALALCFRWPLWPCASPGLCAAGDAVPLSLLHFECSAGTCRDSCLLAAGPAACGWLDWPLPGFWGPLPKEWQPLVPAADDYLGDFL